ncbi:hypothetical protein AB0O20_31740 [Streptomyces kronopolitis]|uniref:bestrophin-like domain n=1 Tax=Streptomyces kronopolitis TaxID=1612435 RepID=UPI00341D953A
MARWFVSNVPPWLLLTGLVVVISCGTAAVQVLVRHRFPHLRAGGRNEVAQFVYPVVGLIYGFLMGFMVLALWGQVTTADQTTRTEGAAAVQLARSAEAFGKPEAARIRQNLLAYGHAATAEWPRASAGRTTPETEDALHRLHTTYESITPRNDSQRAFLTGSLASLRDLTSARTQRLLQARTNTGPPLALWLVIFLNSGLVLGFSVVFDAQQPRLHYGMVATVSILVAANLFLIAELAYPYLGQFATSPAPLDADFPVLSTLG